MLDNTTVYLSIAFGIIGIVSLIYSVVTRCKDRNELRDSRIWNNMVLSKYRTDDNNKRTYLYFYGKKIEAIVTNYLNEDTLCIHDYHVDSGHIVPSSLPIVPKTGYYLVGYERDTFAKVGICPPTEYQKTRYEYLLKQILKIIKKSGLTNFLLSFLYVEIHSTIRGILKRFRSTKIGEWLSNLYNLSKDMRLAIIQIIKLTSFFRRRKRQQGFYYYINNISLDDTLKLHLDADEVERLFSIHSVIYLSIEPNVLCSPLLLRIVPRKDLLPLESPCR